MFDKHEGSKKYMIFGNDKGSRIIIRAREGLYGTDLRLQSDSPLEILDAFCSEIESQFNAAEQAGGGKPPAPGLDESIDKHFAWMHQCQRKGFKVGLKDVAKNAGLSYQTVKNYHTEYLAEHGK